MQSYQVVNKIPYNKFKIFSQNIVFSLISLVIAFITRVPVIPSLPFLKLDISDAPILIATLISGVSSGISVLVTVSIMRFMLFSSAGIVGFLIRMTSILVILSLGYFRKENKNFIKKIIVLLLGIASCIAIKIPLNYVFWVYMFSIPKDVILNMLMPYILPFNIFKIFLNCIIAFLLKNPIEALFERADNI